MPLFVLAHLDKECWYPEQGGGLTGKAGFSLYMRLPHLLAETLLICACFSAASSLRSSQGFLVSLWVWQTLPFIAAELC